MINYSMVQINHKFTVTGMEHISGMRVKSRRQVQFTHEYVQSSQTCVHMCSESVHMSDTRDTGVAVKLWVTCGLGIKKKS